MVNDMFAEMLGNILNTQRCLSLKGSSYTSISKPIWNIFEM